MIMMKVPWDLSFGGFNPHTQMTHPTKPLIKQDIYCHPECCCFFSLVDGRTGRPQPVELWLDEIIPASHLPHTSCILVYIILFVNMFVNVQEMCDNVIRFQTGCELFPEGCVCDPPHIQTSTPQTTFSSMSCCIISWRHLKLMPDDFTKKVQSILSFENRLFSGELGLRTGWYWTEVGWSMNMKSLSHFSPNIICYWRFGTGTNLGIQQQSVCVDPEWSPQQVTLSLQTLFPGSLSYIVVSLILLTSQQVFNRYWRKNQWKGFL